MGRKRWGITALAAKKILSSFDNLSKIVHDWQEMERSRMENASAYYSLFVENFSTVRKMRNPITNSSNNMKKPFKKWEKKEMEKIIVTLAPATTTTVGLLLNNQIRIIAFVWLLPFHLAKYMA